MQTIRIIKLFAWEPQFSDKILKARKLELKVLWQRMMMFIAFLCIGMGGPVLIMSVTLGAYTALFDRLPITSGKVNPRFFGQYQQAGQSVRVRVSNDIQVIAHEVGHHLDLAITRLSAQHRRGPIRQRRVRPGEERLAGGGPGRHAPQRDQQRQQAVAPLYDLFATRARARHRPPDQGRGHCGRSG